MILDVDKLVFGYRKEKNILNQITFSYDSNEIFCILGANGTGKSTLLKCITGEYRANSGKIIIDGKKLSEYSAVNLAQKIAYIPQSHVPQFSFSVLDVVMMGRTSRMEYFSNPGSTERTIAMQKLEFLKIDYLWKDAYTDISGGERQLVMIAAALTQEPEAIIMDEPTAHLDFGNQYRFLKLVSQLKKAGIGVLMTTHFPDHALQLDGRTMLLNNGNILAVGMAKDVITNANMKKLYEIDVKVERIGKRSICIPEEVGELSCDE
jgi:iron complex transport system ATP-binding protein